MKKLVPLVITAAFLAMAVVTALPLAPTAVAQQAKVGAQFSTYWIYDSPEDTFTNGEVTGSKEWHANIGSGVPLTGLTLTLDSTIGGFAPLDTEDNLPSSLTMEASELLTDFPYGKEVVNLRGVDTTKPVSAAPMSVTKPETPSVVNPSITSPYDGTYTGTFNYEYRENRMEKVPDREYSEFVEGEWKTDSFTLTVTLKSLAGPYDVEIFALVTSVYCSDPNFGTGPSAITPAPNSAARLPADPPTTTMNPSGPYMGIQIFFPNGAELYTVTPLTVAKASGDLSVSLTGQTLSGSTWMGVTPSGPFSNIDLAYPLEQYQYNMKGKSWSLTRISHSVLTTTTEPPVTPPTKLTEGTVLTDISGEVYVRKGGVDEWTKYDQTVLKLGDEIRTEDNGKVTIELPNGGLIDLGPRTSFTIRGPDKESFELLIGKIWVSIQKKLKKFEVITPIAVASVRGTEFTVNVDEDGTTTVMVLEGFVEVRDLTSNAGISLPARQMVVLPSIPGGLTQQDMLGKVKVVWPETIDRWWEKDSAATGEQPVVRAPSGIGTVVMVVVAVIVIVMALIFALLLRRRHGRT